MDVARVNFSHGTHAEHAEVIRLIREGEARWGRPIAILQDLQGPKIRLGTFGPAGGARVDLEPGQIFTLCAKPVVGTAERASLNHPEYLTNVHPGDQIWMDDGMVQLRVEEASPEEVRCRVVVGGRLSDHKGISLPRVPLPVSCLTDKDREDLRFGLAHGVDFVAVSFVRSEADIAEVRGSLHELGADVPIVAKLERHEGIVNLPGILRSVAAVMVARGDLGADAIVAFTQSGSSARLISRARPRVPIIALTPFVEVQRRLALSWGVDSRLIRKVQTTDEMIEEVEATLLRDGSVTPGDVLVIISGSPMWVAGTTNLLKLHRVGERR